MEKAGRACHRHASVYAKERGENSGGQRCHPVDPDRAGPGQLLVDLHHSHPVRVDARPRLLVLERAMCLGFPVERCQPQIQLPVSPRP